MKLIDTIRCWCNPETAKSHGKGCGRKASETPHDVVTRRIYVKPKASLTQALSRHWPNGDYFHDAQGNPVGNAVAPFGEPQKPNIIFPDVNRGSDGTRHWYDVKAPRWEIARYVRALKREGLLDKVPE